MKRLDKSKYLFASPLLTAIDHQNFIKTVLAGLTPGYIYVDDLSSPKLSVAQFRHRVCLSSDPTQNLNIDLKNFFLGEVVRNCKSADVPLFRLACNHPDLLNMVHHQLKEQSPISLTYQCYQHTSHQVQDIGIPTDFELQIVDRALLDQEFEGKEDLIEEMCSERFSVESFLQQSFGIAAFHKGKLAGWCLSEYNFKDRCEVGIATMQPFQQRGLAKSMTIAFLKIAHKKGYKRIFWHCDKANVASWKTALAAGFTLLEEEQVLIFYHEPAIHFGVHGNLLFEKQAYADSIKWYQRALDQDNPQIWVAWNAACAAANDDQVDLAFDFLSRAINMGFSDRAYLINSKHLQTLKTDHRWQELLGALDQ